MELLKFFIKCNINKFVEFKEIEWNFYILVNFNVIKFYDVLLDFVFYVLKYLNNDVDLLFKVIDFEYLFIKMKFDVLIFLFG